MARIYHSLNAGFGAQGTAQWNGDAKDASLPAREPGASPDWQPYDYK
jgi:hypothetical protein